MHFKMLSAICFNLDQSKILSSGQEIYVQFSQHSPSVLVDPIIGKSECIYGLN